MRSSRLVHRGVACVAVVLLSIAAAACSGGSSGGASGGSSGSGADAGNVTKGELPANFPSDIPLCDGYVVQAAIDPKVTTSAGSPVTVTVTCAGSIAQVADAAKAKLDKSGWKITEASTTDAGGTVLANKGGRKLTLLLVKDPNTGKTGVIIAQAGAA